MITIEQELENIIGNTRKYLANDKNMRAKTSIIKNARRLEWIASTKKAIHLEKFLGNLWLFAITDENRFTPSVRKGIKKTLLKELDAAIPEIKNTNWPAPIIEI